MWHISSNYDVIYYLNLYKMLNGTIFSVFLEF